MKKKHRNEEASAVIGNMMDDILFYFREYREDIDKWGEAFKTEFNNRIDAIIAEMKAEEEGED